MKMTIQGAIDAAKRLRDSEYTDEDFVGWLSAHDENLYDRVLSKYGIPRPETLPYTQYIADVDPDDIDLELDLMLPDKYGLELYPLWLVLQIDLHNGDFERYNNDAVLYNRMEVEMRKDYSREMRWQPQKPENWPEERPWKPARGLRF